MARREILNAILQSFKKLGGNTNDVLGTKTNISFLGKGKSPELMLDMDINTEALGVLPQSKAVEELKSSVGYAVSGKLNDIQANQLLKNMKAMENFYFPPAAPANITDLATRTRNLDKEGLMSLRQADDTVFGLKDYDTSGMSSGKQKIIQLEEKLGKLNADAPNFREKAKPLVDEIELRSKFPNASDKDINDALRLGIKDLDDLPPPGSRGGPDDIAEPSFSGAGLEAIKNVKGSNLIVNDIVNKIYLNAGVAENAQPVVRANAREFLNRIKDLTDEPGNPTLAGVMEADDFKFMTEGGGGGMGDPLLLVQKYFGPKVASAVAKLDGPNDIQLFAERLISVKDAKGRGVTDRFFDPESVDLDDFEFADGGRVPFMAGMLVRGGKMGYQALRKYGIEGKDISRLFASLGSDKSLVGKEKTAYFQQLHKVLKNPDAFPDEIMDIQKQLGIDVGLGFRNGGLAGILEV